ncbi:MAG: class I SAM-dependent methyltransferase [Spirochaetales bacterium]|nr:class I SAM-dependent methyltransferase [Spirochaetales bacterium]
MQRFINKLILHVRKPKGFLGLLMARGMNSSHNKMTNWGLEFINVKDKKNILDIGCGGGRTLKKLSISSPDSTVYGIDYSKESIAISTGVNKKDIKKGKVILKESGVSALPFGNNFFDLITAIETYFFWPDLKNDMKEVLRVLKPNGTFLIISGEYKNDKNNKFDKRNKSFVEKLNMHYHSPEDLTKLLTAAGFKDLRIEEQFEKGWLCAISKK